MMFRIRKGSLKWDILGGAFALFAIAMLLSSPTWATTPDQTVDHVDSVSIVDSIDFEVDCI